MYVVELDRPWLETSFKFQGFEIETKLKSRLSGAFANMSILT
ncbi:MAG: DUF3391 domain-containing protein [Methylobacter sp.]|nr:DUF3391 domain-containing protein [Methylobacter sp.]